MKKWGWLLAVVSAVTGASTVWAAQSAARFEFPALMQPKVSEEHPGKLIWAELVTPDLAGAQRFYGGLFGWKFEPVHAADTEYAVALLDGAPIAGLVQRALPADGHGHPAWLPFLSVRSVREAGRGILSHGGRTVIAAHTYARRGRQGVYADPDGAVFAVLHSSSGDPPDVLAAPGEWIWSALVTPQPDADAAFYQDVFGFEVFDMSADAPEEHLVLASQQFARASVNAPPAAAQPPPQPHWISYVRVSSVADTVARAAALGGRVLVASHPGRHGGPMAIIADPQGAPIGVLEWTEPAGQAGTK